MYSVLHRVLVFQCDGLSMEILEIHSDQVDEYKRTDSTFPRLVHVFVAQEGFEHKIDWPQLWKGFLDAHDKAESLQAVLSVNHKVYTDSTLDVSSLDDWDLSICYSLDLFKLLGHDDQMMNAVIEELVSFVLGYVVQAN